MLARAPSLPTARPSRKPHLRRPNPVFSEAYRALLGAVVECRKEAGLSQRDLAAQLGKCASHVGMIERGQRRIDTLELYRTAKVFQVRPEDLFARIARRIDALESAGGDQSMMRRLPGGDGSDGGSRS